MGTEGRNYGIGPQPYVRGTTVFDSFIRKRTTTTLAGDARASVCSSTGEPPLTAVSTVKTGTAPTTARTTFTAESISRKFTIAGGSFYDPDDGDQILAPSRKEWDGDAETAEKFAADLSLGLFMQLRAARPLQGLGFDKLLVLTLSGSAMDTKHLEEVMLMSTKLRKLDASHCCLTAAPSATAFKGLAKLIVLFLHKNQLSIWEDIERVMQAPALQWFTAFENPIASQPEFRQFVIQQNPRIRAVGQCMVTDGEHTDFVQHSSASRFAIRSQESIVCLNTHLLPEVRTPRELLTETQQELWLLQHRGNRVSAACCIQSWFKACVKRHEVHEMQRRLLRAAICVQRHARTFIWRQQMMEQLQEFLGEINELDLLLSAKEMLRLRAAKCIEAAVRRFLHKRSKQKMLRKAAECINRIMRGFLARREVLKKHLDIRLHRKLYFPEEYAWEFLAMLNAVRRMNKLATLPHTHRFKPADIVGIRIPDTDEVPQAQASIVSVERFGRHCVVRPKRNNRYPGHLWDGPIHRLVDDDSQVPASIVQAYHKVRRRGANVDNQCRKMFLGSCAPSGGKHPIDESCEGDVAEQGEEVSLVMKAILESPESEWPWEARQKGKPLNMFMVEARHLGARPRRSKDPQGIHTRNGSQIDPKTGLPCYRKAVWLNQRMLCHDCVSEKIVVDLLLLLLGLSRSTTRMPLVKPVPFLTEKAAKMVAAVTVIQSSFRAHRVRCTLSCGLRTATVIRRAALCIQRGWRWGLMKRRLELLIGAAKYVQSVKTNSLYIEERLLTALNVISSVDRYPPLLQERTLGLGYSAENTNIALVRGDMKGAATLKGTTAKDALKAKGLRREGGLPRWFVQQMGDLQALGPDSPALKRLCGVKALLLEDIGDRTEDHVSTITMASIKHAAKLAADIPEKRSSALVACAGTFRFVEMRFHSLAEARQRALLVYLCTFNSQHHNVVPMLSRSQLHDSNVCQSILELWDLYGLTWPAGDRAASYQLKLRGEKFQGEVVPLCGNQPLRHAVQMEWKTDGDGVEHKETDRKGGWLDRLAKREEANCQRYASFVQQFSDKRQREIATQRRRVQETSIERLHDDHKVGAFGVCINGALPPTTSDRVDPNPSALVRAEKTAAKSIIAAAKEAEEHRVKHMHDSVIDSQGTGGKRMLDFEENIRAFHSEDQAQPKHVRGRRDSAKECTNTQEIIEAEHRELTNLLAFERAHKKAESKIIERSIALEKAVQMAESTDSRGLQEKAQKRVTTIRQEELQMTNTKRAEVAAQKAKRQLMQQNIKQFLSKRYWIENAVAKHDAMRRQDKDLDTAQTRRLDQQEAWDQRSAALAEREYVRQEHRNAQNEMSRQQREHMVDMRRQIEKETVSKKHWHIQAIKGFDAMLKDAAAEVQAGGPNRNHMITPGNEDVGVPGSYQQALSAFRHMAQEVKSMMEAAQADGANANLVLDTSWLTRNWAWGEGDGQHQHDFEDELDNIPDNWLAKLQSLELIQARQEQDPDSPGRAERIEPLLLLPSRPALQPPRSCGRLPRSQVMADGTVGLPGTAGKDGRAASHSLPPLHAHRATKALHAHSPVARFMRSPRDFEVEPGGGAVVELSKLTAAEAPVGSLFEEDLVHRSLMSAKKAHGISAATLSTAYHTDSMTTLLSSQKSLPPVPAALSLPALPRPPALAAFRGNPRPPMVGRCSIVTPPGGRKALRKAPYTAR